MPDWLTRLNALPFRDVPDWAWWAAGAAVLLVVMRAALRGKSAPRSSASEGLSIRLASLRCGLPAEGPRVECYGVPVRIACAVVAPAGRGPNLSSQVATTALGRVLPRMDEVLRTHQTQVMLWPAQLSAAGFQTAFFHQAGLPGDHGRDTPWSVLSGKVTLGDRHYLIGLICCGDQPNPLGETIVEHEARWLDVLRIGQEPAH